MTGMSPEIAERYSHRVVEVLSGEFGAKLDAAEVVRRLVYQRAVNPDLAFAVIVDNPALANWRLTPDARRGCVRLACYRLPPQTEADAERERRVNTALRAIELR